MFVIPAAKINAAEIPIKTVSCISSYAAHIAEAAPARASITDAIEKIVVFLFRFALIRQWEFIHQKSITHIVQ